MLSNGFQNSLPNEFIPHLSKNMKKFANAGSVS